VEVFRTDTGIATDFSGGASLIGSGNSRRLTASEAAYDATTQLISIPPTGVGEIYTVDFWSAYPLVAAPALGNLNAHAISLWPKLLAWWELDETSGTTMVDAHTGGYNGSYGSAVTINQSPLGTNLSKSIKLDGTTGASNTASVAHNSGLDVRHNVACFIWIKPDNTSPIGAYPWLLSKDAQGSGLDNYCLVYDRVATGKVVFRVTSGAAAYDIASTSVITNGQTYFAFGQRSNYDGVHASTTQIWLNGVLENTNNTGPVGQLDISTFGGLSLGANWSVGTDTNFKGNLDQAAVFTDALTSDEIAYLYNSGNGVSYATMKAQSGH